MQLHPRGRGHVQQRVQHQVLDVGDGDVAPRLEKLQRRRASLHPQSVAKREGPGTAATHLLQLLTRSWRLLVLLRGLGGDSQGRVGRRKTSESPERASTTRGRFCGDGPASAPSEKHRVRLEQHTEYIGGRQMSAPLVATHTRLPRQLPPPGCAFCLKQPAAAPCRCSKCTRVRTVNALLLATSQRNRRADAQTPHYYSQGEMVCRLW